MFFLGISTYDPNQLFSERTDDVRTSIKSLYNTPQNNFRVLFNGNHIYGGNKCTVTDKEIVDHLLHVFFSGAIRDQNSNITQKRLDINEKKYITPYSSNKKKDKKEVISGGTYITDVLTEILRTEDVLYRVFRFQILDLLDVEGG